MSQNCETCKWGPRQINCQRPQCKYVVMSNGELIRRLTDEQLAEFLCNFPVCSKVDVIGKWIGNPASDEMLRSFGGNKNYVEI